MVELNKGILLRPFRAYLRDDSKHRALPYAKVFCPFRARTLSSLFYDYENSSSCYAPIGENTPPTQKTTGTFQVGGQEGLSPYQAMGNNPVGNIDAYGLQIHHITAVGGNIQDESFLVAQNDELSRNIFWGRSWDLDPLNYADWSFGGWGGGNDAKSKATYQGKAFGSTAEMVAYAAEHPGFTFSFDEGYLVGYGKFNPNATVLKTVYIVGYRGSGGKRQGEEKGHGIKTVQITTEAVANSYDVTKGTVIAAQKLANKMAGTTYKILRGGKWVEGTSRGLAAFQGGLIVYDVLSNSQIKASNVLEGIITRVSFFHSWGWIVGGVYYGADLMTQGITGQLIGQHLDNAVGGPLVEW